MNWKLKALPLIVLSLTAVIFAAVPKTVVAQQELMEALLGDLPTDPQELADKIVEDVAAIRGLEFTRDIAVSNQSLAEFEQYLANEMGRTLPAERASVFGRVINKLGLYKGPIIEDSVEMITLLATSQAAAYYDPSASAFYVLIGDASMALLAPIYAHELYHGLQDQYWDLDAYLLDGLSAGLNDDEMLARQAVVEGEATYVMTLWLMREMTGTVPSGFMLDIAVQMQTQMDVEGLRDMAATGIVPGALSEDLQASIDAMDQIPLFMLETMIGVYLKGMGFIHEVVKNGWQEVESLYMTPPTSTEQILHPEKWLTRDDPVLIDFPDLASAPVLDGWTLLDTNVIGEFQLRIIFNEFEMTDVSSAAAAGWDGDRYAVFERNEDLLLLLATTWDSEAEATEFAAAYQQLLARKYPDQAEVTGIERRGNDVLIVEGGSSADTADFLGLLAAADKR